MQKALTHHVPWVLAVCLGLLWTGCAPSLSPLYRDFESPPSGADTVATISDQAAMQELKKALREAGWEIAASRPDLIETKVQTVQDLGLYKINVHLEVLPVDGTYMRVLFHPYRKYFFGHETKLLFLKSDIRQELLPPLQEALQDRGFRALGTARSRARESGA